MTPDDTTREWVRALFSDPDAAAEPDAEPPTPPEAGNVAPLEGSNPELDPNPNADLRAYSRALFGITD